MRAVSTEAIGRAVERLFVRANRELPPDLIAALKLAREREESPRGRQVLDELLANARAAVANDLPPCQDTGVAVVFVELGQEIRLEGGPLAAAVDAGVARATAAGRLRASMFDLLAERNTSDNTPAVLHLEPVPGDRLAVTVLAKGGGCENASRAATVTPAGGLAAARDFVVAAIRENGQKACPPLILGVGVGGGVEDAACRAKRSLLRPLGPPHPNPAVAALEAEWLKAVNDLGLGPMGYGGRVTALAVHLDIRPAHAAGIPVALSVQCHAHRWAREEL